MSAQLLQDENDQSQKRCDTKEGLTAGELKMFKRAEGDEDEEEAQHEAVAVVEPVGLLEAVPDEVDGAGGKGGHEE